MIGLSPPDIRRSSLWEFMAQVDGWWRANKPEDGPDNLSAGEIADLSAMLDEDKARG